MKLIRPLLVLAVTVALLALPSSAFAAKAKKKKKGGAAAGVVEQVSADKLVVKVMGKKKKGAPAEGVTKTFTLNKDTKFEMVSGKKKNKTTTPATSVDVKTGGRVLVTANGDKAESVKILGGKKKKKKKNV